MLLIQLTKDDPVRQYQKSNLKPYYVQGAVRDRILKRMPEDLQKTMKEHLEERLLLFDYRFCVIL